MTVEELRNVLKYIDGDKIVWVSTQDDDQSVGIITSDQFNLRIYADPDTKMYPDETMEWQER